MHMEDKDKASLDVKQEEIGLDEAISVLESFLFTFSEPVGEEDIVHLFKANAIKIKKSEVKSYIEILEKRYRDRKSGLCILQVQDKYQLVTKRENYRYLEKVLEPKKKKNLTQSAIETLTIIAYNQPVTKSFVEKIKGVKCDTTITKLLQAGLIEDCGRLDKIGRPILYKTTDLFLKHLNITSVKDLPEINTKKEE